jgi:hypothetical protein
MEMYISRVIIEGNELQVSTVGCGCCSDYDTYGPDRRDLALKELEELKTSLTEAIDEVTDMIDLVSRWHINV